MVLSRICSSKNRCYQVDNLLLSNMFCLYYVCFLLFLQDGQFMLFMLQDSGEVVIFQVFIEVSDWDYYVMLLCLLCDI